MTCDYCRREITEDDVRVVTVPRSWDEPSHDEEACRFCCPDPDELEAARDAYYDRMRDEAA